MHRWNCLAWTFGTASASIYGAEAILALYSLYHPDFSPSNYQFFLAFLGVTWISCGLVLFGQPILTYGANSFAMTCLAVWFVSLMVVSIMPSTKNGYATHDFVWKQWNNQTGYSSNGLVFCLGMLNGAFAIGTPDGCTHGKQVLHQRNSCPVTYSKNVHSCRRDPRSKAQPSQRHRRPVDHWLCDYMDILRRSMLRHHIDR